MTKTLTLLFILSSFTSIGQSFDRDTIQKFSLNYELNIPLPMSKIVIDINEDGTGKLLFTIKNRETKSLDTLAYKIIKTDQNTFRQMKENILHLSESVSEGQTLSKSLTSDGTYYDLQWSYNVKTKKFSGYDRVSVDKDFAELHDFIFSVVGYFPSDYIR